MNIEILGYHGTTQKAANLIIENSSFNKSFKKNEWLGHGVYFFEKYPKAEWWARQQRKKGKPGKKEKPAVITSKIAVSEEDFLDLDLPEEEDELVSFVRHIENSGSTITFPSNKIEKRCAVINMYMKIRKYKVIMKSFNSTNSNGKDILDSMGLSRIEKQICVHNTNCIVSNELSVLS
ncbi:hypothetical protein JGY90_05690 [Staphylococcus xylosus]|uniref:hypothetical protein n=1 Tax=Staphylococcus xylosus TaxID=1288 RepID=UPI001CDC72DB|nr:hypothetical protein [Staphylococcus xylosus]UBV35747.1 hypothetical protein JGY90_05690 [Staphylococcus xylosus]